MSILAADRKINNITLLCEYYLGTRYNIIVAYKARRDLRIAYSDIDYKLYDKSTREIVSYTFFYRGISFIR